MRLLPSFLDPSGHRRTNLARRALLLLAWAAVPVSGQSTSEIIRGRVVGPDSQPLTRAEVRVTGLLTRATQVARTDARGVYTLVFPQAEGEYLVAVRSVGFRSTSFRLSRIGLSPVLGADVRLEAVSQILDRVVVTAGPVPGERSAIGELASGDLADSLFLADPSRLMELLLSIPGVLSIDDSSFSVMGSASGQNLTTLDGVAIRGAVLPPDALASIRVVTSSADPARGGFSGGNVSQTLKGGTDIFGAMVRVSGANRGMAWNDPAWTRPLPRLVSQSGTVNGPIVRQKVRYNVSWQFEDVATAWYSLLEPRGALLSQRGISLDSVAAVTGALESLGVPLSLSSGPREANQRSLRVSSVLDVAPSATSSFRVSHAMSVNGTLGSGASETSFPTRVNDVGSAAHNVGVRSSSYVHGLLNEFTLGLSFYRDHSDPFTLLPGGSVRVGTDFADGRTGFSSLTFGGGTGRYFENSSSGEVQDEVSWIPADGAHKVKLGGRYAMNRNRQFYFPGSPLLGTYTYLSIADLAANRPAQYERVLANATRQWEAANSSAWIGDEWRASAAWQVQGGLRMDFMHPATIPAYNPAVDAAFGVRTDFVPRDVGLSPRIGFSWASAARRGRGTGGSASTLGGMSAEAVARMSPELVTSLVSMQRASTLPGIGITGTFGAYRGTINGGTIADMVEATGLPGTRVTLSCVGAAVPVPDWAVMTEGPAACADGSTGSTFSLARPLVQVFAPSFQAPTNWRGNLGIDGIRVPNQWILSINAGASWNTHGQSAVDLNLNRTPRFALAGEADRPVFVPLAAIVPATGSISPGASRTNPDFATVTSMLSDLRSYNAQLQASIAPPNPLLNRRLTLQLNYTLSAGRQEQRGTSRIGTTGDPFEKQWVRTAQPRHTFRFTTGGRFWGLNLGAGVSLLSGIPLTPLVSGDVNGDGYSGNDRAFIPDPATTPDTSLARQMTELLAHARPGARECLVSQLGRMAGANTCRTPWQARIDLSASFTPPSSWNYSDRLRLTFNLTNASGALVRAAGLENTPFGQSSLSTTPTATLLYITGFDPSSGRYRYRVNQLFGEPTNYGSARRRYGPSQLQFGLEYVFGGPMLNPIARGLGLREPPSQPPLTVHERMSAIARLKKDPVAPYLALKDSLDLTADQRDRLDILSREFHASADSALTPLLNWVLKKGTRVFDRDLARPLSGAQAALGRVTADYRTRAQAILTAAQRSLVAEPAPAARRER